MQKDALSPIVYYGGTFDPIHMGHINVCKSINEIFNFKQIFILPNHIPPHRDQPIASACQRVKMISLAIKHEPLFRIDSRELNRQKHSYTVDTLIELRSEHGTKRPLFFIIGEDSLYSIDKWHKWEQLLDYTHLIVCKRAKNHHVESHEKVDKLEKFESNERIDSWLTRNQETSPNKLLLLPKGKIYLAPTPYYDISATLIRNLLKAQSSTEHLLNSDVFQFIQEHQIYF